MKALRVTEMPVEGATVILAPHPDDEVFGCAGLVQKALNTRQTLYVVVMTGGGESISGIDEEKLKEERRFLTRKAANVLGFPHENIIFLDYPDGKISYEHPETEKLYHALLEIRPDQVLIPHHGEGWPDHLVVKHIFEQLRKRGLRKEIKLYEYCVWMWYYNVWHLNWKQARLVRMTKAEHDRKKKAIALYVNAIAENGKPYSGFLPDLFVKACSWKNELYFEII